MWYEREISDLIVSAAKRFPVIVLTGSRQAGKTTLLKRLFPNYAYVALDIPSVASLAQSEPEDFFDRFKEPLIVDEVQYSPGIFRHLKSRVDERRHEMGRFILTGSQKFTLMKEVSDSLAGRCAVLDLETLSVNEISRKDQPPNTARELSRVMVRGGFPELWRDQEIPSDVFYRSYLATYLERDVRQILNVSSLRDFERFIRACASRTGQVLNKSAMAREVGVSIKAITSWLSVLEASNQVFFLEPWFSNFGKRLAKSPKMYLCDTGLLCFLLGLTEKSLSQSPFIGPVWETLVCSELRKSVSIGREPVHLWFYRDSQQLEVDFIVLGGGHGRLIECKWSQNPGMRDARNLERVAELVSKKGIPDFSTISKFVIARPDVDHPIGEDTWAIGLAEVRSRLGLTAC